MPTTVLITGCSAGGIGHALAQAFARLPDVHVFATARTVSKMSGLADAGCTLVPLDVTDAASVADAAAKVAAATGGRGVDVLINNAGNTFKGCILDCPPDACAELMATNVVSIVRVTQAFAPAMCRRGRGVIVNLGSATSWISQATKGVYSASKHAVRSLNDSLRVELAPFGVRVILVAPGYVATPIDDKAADSGRWFSPAAASPHASFPGLVATTKTSIFKKGMGAQGAMPPAEFAAKVSRIVMKELARARAPGAARRGADPTAKPPTPAEVLACPRNWLPQWLGGPTRHVLIAPFGRVAWFLGCYAPGWVTDLLLAKAAGVWVQ